MASEAGRSAGLKKKSPFTVFTDTVASSGAR